MNFNVGDKAKVTKRENGHHFNIGELITIKMVHELDYLAENEMKGSWFIRDSELVPIEKPITQDEMYLNMQYYMEFCQSNGYITPQDFIEKYKHF